MLARVKKIYDYCKDNDIKMLSDFDADFWEVYIQNSDYFDRLFRNSYREFVAFNLKDAVDIEEAVEDWVFDIAAFLKANEKRYAELWRLQVISDVDYSILDNYNVRETHITDNDKESTNVFGSKTDTKNSTLSYGQVTETDTNSYVHGNKSESDSETINYDDESIRTQTELNVGTQHNTTENTVSADNVSTYSPKDFRDDISGTRQDSTDTTETRAAREDTKSGTHTEASYTDSESKSHSTGQHSDTVSNSNVYGAQTNTHTTTEDETRTVTRKGNIGVYSASRLLSEHKDLWECFNFYKLIFDEIADNFLRIIYD